MEALVTSKVEKSAIKGNAAIRGAMTAQYDPEKLKHYYRTWHTSYDDDVELEGYVGPQTLVAMLRSDELAEAAQSDLRNSSLRIMDAGCGTGRVGRVLSEFGYSNVHGCDLSPEMAELAARTGSYLATYGDTDLHMINDHVDAGSFDVVTCCGTFTGGHVRPDALTELSRMARPGGLLLISVRQSYYEEADFGAAYMRYIESGCLQLSHSAVWAPYIDEEHAHYFAFEVKRAAQ